MTTLRRVRVTWTGLTGLPGISTFYTLGTDDVTTNLATFFSSISNRFSASLTWSCPSTGDTIEDSTGALNGAWVGGTAFSQTGSGGTSAYAAGTGAMIFWGTGTIVGRRRLKGRTFLAPINSAEYSSSGTISAAALTTLSAASATLVGTGKLRVWHRPPKGGSTGSNGLVTGATVPSFVTSLKSRRF